jgi:dimethylhistidine N-methyltransferase
MNPSPEKTQFASDVLEGLSATPKALSSKYFYDDEGTHLFRQIMNLPEYYPTRCEYEIFETRGSEILAAFANGRNAFDLIELGAGDGAKTAVLVRQFLECSADITYSPIDISEEALDTLAASFRAQFPDLRMNPMPGDYFQMLRLLKNEGVRRKVILFLGSNIGNFSRERSIWFFKELAASMNQDDLVFIGFDLQKDPRVIVKAYDDSQGVTAEFNLNLLRRINRELHANFDLDKFSHYALYQPIECAARSFLISRERQVVRIDALNSDFEFEQWEPIFMEISQKYSMQMIEEIAAESGFEIKQNFFDRKNYYCDSLWKIA